MLYQSDKEGWRKYWQGVYGMPRAWAIKGENLIHAYEAVAAASVPGSMNLDTRDQAYMLAGMGIEVLLKSLIVDNLQLRELVTGVRKLSSFEKKIEKIFYSHHLSQIAGVADVPLSDIQMGVADLLSTFILWRGRYIMPREKGLDDIIPIQRADGLVGPPGHPASASDVRDLVDYVITQVKNRLYG